jgi:N-methylhydantoinase B
MPEDVSAMWASHVPLITFGDDAREFDEEAQAYRKFYFCSFGPDGGSGAIWGYDGWPHVTPPILAGGVTKNTVEITEIMTPWRILQYGYLPDSAGAGRWRGGYGTHYEMINENGGRVYVNSGTSSGMKFRPFGQAGGKDAIYHDLYFIRDGEKVQFRTVAQVPYTNGDIVVAKCSGGGGVGDPLERPAELVREDVFLELLSVEKAAEDYGVVINSKTLEVDEAATEKLRAEMHSQG